MLHLITGNTGAGKSTYSNQLKKEDGGIVFSIDQWSKVLFLDDQQDTHTVDWFLERIARSDTLIKELVKQLESQGMNSILDLGFAKQARREDWIAFARAENFKTQLHYLDVSSQTRLKRVQQRNTEQGDTFQFEVTHEQFEFMETWFEIPSQLELKDAIIITNENE